jgi:hypothetical protein
MIVSQASRRDIDGIVVWFWDTKSHVVREETIQYHQFVWIETSLIVSQTPIPIVWILPENDFWHKNSIYSGYVSVVGWISEIVHGRSTIGWGLVFCSHVIQVV